MIDNQPSESTTPESDAASATDSREDEIHKGYDLESGVLARVREWTDLLPWLRLIRTLRVAGSPPVLSIVAVALAIWLTGHVNWFGDSLRIDMQSPGSAMTSSPAIENVAAGLAMQSQLLNPTRLIAMQSLTSDWLQSAAAILWAMLIWIPVTLVLIRQGALLTAKRPMMGFVAGIKFSLKRTGYAWVVALVPLACVAFLVFDIYLLGWIGTIGSFVAIPLSVLVVLLSLVGGLLMFGAYIAIPMAWSALVNEKDPDPLDSLSRGYEYLYRRPIELFVSGLMGLFVLAVATSIAMGITIAAQQIANGLTLGGADDTTIQYSLKLLAFCPLVVSITVFWSLVGGIYLMMRGAAGGQEVEDLWVPPVPAPPALPSLPQGN